MLRLLLVEDHAMFRDALAFVLDRHPDMEVAARAGSLAECRALGCLDAVDVAVLDIRLPDGDGTDLIGELREANPGVRVLILTASIDAGIAGRAEGLGADGLLNKTASLAEIASEVVRLAGVGDA